MTHPIKLIVGLANPGKEYEKTRHNAGAWFIQSLINTSTTQLKVVAKFHGAHATINLHQTTCHLFIPNTFMNHSGRAVQAIMTYYGIEAENILIAHDDIDIPVGVVKLKFDGGDGGHNGLKDIIHYLHTKKFYRLRIGVGRPPLHMDVADYVLNKPSKEDLKNIESAILSTHAALELILQGHMQKAMQHIHTS